MKILQLNSNSGWMFLIWSTLKSCRFFNSVGILRQKHGKRVDLVILRRAKQDWGYWMSYSIPLEGFLFDFQEQEWLGKLSALGLSCLYWLYWCTSCSHQGCTVLVKQAQQKTFNASCSCTTRSSLSVSS